MLPVIFLSLAHQAGLQTHVEFARCRLQFRRGDERLSQLPDIGGDRFTDVVFLGHCRWLETEVQLSTPKAEA